MSNREPVWITGAGLATPLGFDYASFAEALFAGTAGVRRITQFNAENHICQVAGWLDPIPSPANWDPHDFAAKGPWEQLAFSCAINALQDSGWWDQRSDIRIGVVLGIGAEWMLNWENRINSGEAPFLNPDSDQQGLARSLSRSLGLTGPVTTVGAACASGNVALNIGREWVRLGWADVCLAGGVDRPVSPMGLACFGNLSALTRRNDSPATASRPFDRGRDGFVLGEGGTIFTLESPALARKRGAKVYGEIAGYGASSDAFHPVMPSNDPAPAASAIQQALVDAELNPGDIDYVNAHATSTPVGDIFEARAIKLAFGEVATKVPVSATKSMTGHLVSAASAVEALICMAAFERQAVPPTINLDDPDPECDLCHVALESRPQPVNIAISNSFGFGGSNTCVVLRKVG
jgi:3-oxoacyl-[acyl-carrier-protein] synthase II